MEEAYEIEGDGGDAWLCNGMCLKNEKEGEGSS